MTMSVTGKDLIGMGYRPGKWFGEALSYINLNDLNGQDLVAYLEKMDPKYILPHEEAKPYHVNIKAANEIERSNVASVLASMEVLMRTPTLIEGAVMPDACPTGAAGHIPVGGIAVAENAIHPAMHSADICCSVMMTSFGHVPPHKVLDAAHSVTHFGPGGRDEFSELPKELMDDILNNTYLNSEKSIFLAQSHLGTQGDGNHFLFVGQSEKTGETIMVTHHGSRGFGAYLFKNAMKVAESFRKERSPKTKPINAWIPFDTEEGERYWEALQIIRSWTKLNHETIHNATASALATAPKDRFWNEHNFVFREGSKFYHAKGATPLDPKFVPDATSGLRLIPLNMSEPVLMVEGETTATNLGFAPHGAGRNISRSEHRRNNSDRTIEEIFAMETRDLDVRFFSGNIDITELPSAYKNAAAVQEQMAEFGLGRVVDKILPYGSIMAGDWQKDAPWRKKRK